MSAKKNVMWSPSAGQPPAYVMDCREKITLPPAKEMKEGFFSDEPEKLKRLLGGRLKDYAPKRKRRSKK